MDPGAFYTLFLDENPILLPTGAYALKGHDISHEEIAAALDDGEFDEGAVYWVSCENEDLRVTLQSAAVVVDHLDPDQRYKLFTVVGKAAIETLAPLNEEVGISEHRIEGALVTRGDQVTAGSLHGIDQGMWEKGREYLVFVRYELRPLPAQDGDPGPMLAPAEDGEFANCFVRQVVDHFKTRMTNIHVQYSPSDTDGES